MVGRTAGHGWARATLESGLRAVVGGPALATVATLFFVPVVFSVLRRKGAPRHRFVEDAMRVPQSI